MEQTTFAALLEKYLNGSITPEEKHLFVQLTEEPANRKILEEALQQTMLTDQYLFPVSAAQTERFIEKLSGSLHPTMQGRKVVPLYRRWQAVAGILLLLSAGIYVWTRYSKAPRQLAVEQTNKPLHNGQPGRNGAVLTLEDGSQVVLDSTNIGLVATQGSTKVVFDEGGLNYQQSVSSNVFSYNTVHTPRGRQFKLVLPDGTKVWLNAASSLRYPTAFIGHERTVEITGEAYLEVTQQVDMPFKVVVNDQLSVQVLGTSFNINAYKEEKTIQTTLLTGKVQVSAAGATSQVILQPGQQASLQEQTGKLLVGPANQEQVLAWKNGYFQFNRADIQTIMRQIERWYNVEVIYQDIPQKKFSGTIPRDVNVSEVFKILEMTGNVQFDIAGNKVTVRS